MTAKIKLNAASGGGSISIQAPSSSSNNRVIALPDIADGTLVTSESTLDATNLSGNLPAISGAALTGISAGITMADSWRITSSFSVGSGTTDITANWERDDNNFEKIGDGLTQSSGIFTFPVTGKYLLLWNHSIESSSAQRYAGILAMLSSDTGSSYSTLSETYDSMHDYSGNSAFSAGASTIIADVTNATTFKLKWTASSGGSVTFDGNTNQQRTGFTCIKLGDT